MFVTKASGEREEFDPEKIRRTCLKVGASKALTDKVVKDVESKAYDGISTKEILHMILEQLHKKKPFIAARYDLKGSIYRLGPAGFVFEHLVSELLRYYDYKTKMDTIVSGACVSHEVDIIATKNNRNYMIECKYHNMPGIYTGLREALYTYACFLDLRDGYKRGVCQKFGQPWLVCNTKFSDDTIQYASCKRIKLIGWNYPEKRGLKDMLEKRRLYPVTILRGIDEDSLEKLSSANMVLILDLLKFNIKELSKITGINVKKLKGIIDEARGISKI